MGEKPASGGVTAASGASLGTTECVGDLPVNRGGIWIERGGFERLTRGHGTYLPWSRPRVFAHRSAALVESAGHPSVRSDAPFVQRRKGALLHSGLPG